MIFSQFVNLLYTRIGCCGFLLFCLSGQQISLAVFFISFLILKIWLTQLIYARRNIIWRSCLLLNPLRHEFNPIKINNSFLSVTAWTQEGNRGKIGYGDCRMLNFFGRSIKQLVKPLRTRTIKRIAQHLYPSTLLKEEER